MKKLAIFTLATTALFSACGGGGDGQGGEVQVLPFASQSTAIAISPDDATLVAVNENADSVSVFNLNTEPPTLIKEVPVGDEPVAVVVAPDGDTAYVANQADATVSKIVNLTGNPTVVDTAEVGSEPVGLALSPTGTFLYVAELSQARVSKVNTENLQTVDSAAAYAPFGIAVTNDFDQDDNDEMVVVTQFYGAPQGVETQDNSRLGLVNLFRAGDLGSAGTVRFQPRDSGVVPTGANATVTASPNQLYAVGLVGNRFFVPTISVSPTRPIQVEGGNLHPIVLAGDVAAKAEIQALSVNLEQKIQELLPVKDGKRNFLSGTASLAASASESGDDLLVFYTVSRGGDAVQRVAYDLASNQVSVDDFDKDGQPDQIDLFPACRTPMGIAVKRQTGRAYVNCRGTRNLVSLDLGQQVASSNTRTSTPPAAGSEAFDVERGQLLFFTARARWSSESRSDCAACHANGTLSDNVTWTFATGPRRTIPMHWSYQDLDGDGKKETQRMLNWTAINDELRDFEGNVIGVSGGVGVLTPAKDDDPANCASLATQDPTIVNIQTQTGLLDAVIDIEEEAEAPGSGIVLCAAEDWDQVDAFTATMRTPRAPKTFGNEDLEDSIERGRNLFAQGGCFQCHGGPAWSASRLFYEVSRENTADLALNDPVNFEPFDDQPLIDAFGVGSGNSAHIQFENGVNPFVQAACVLRNVGTFGDPLDAALTALVEVKNNGQAAQGDVNGYNVPNLLGVALNAPFFHNGLARTMEELLTDPSWSAHLKRANPNFALAGGQQVADMKNFLFSIDTTTQEFPLNQIVDVCPQ